MDSTSNSHMTMTTSTDTGVINRIKKRIRSLRKKHTKILQIQESVDQGKSLNKDQQDLLSSRASVVARINLLDKLSNQISSALDSIKLEPGSPAQLPIQSMMHVSNPKDSVGESVTNQEKYLCISDGFVIYCLDLKQSKQESNRTNPYDIPLLPKISTLKLPENGLPVAGGLFKLGSNAYLIGGREFPALETDQPHKWFKGVFRSLARLPGLGGTSRATYSLSLVDGNLSIDECDSIKPLKRPIAWPIVEKIGGQIHVIESFADLFDYDIAKDPHHAVLNIDDVSRGWVRIKSIRDLSNTDWIRAHGARIRAHLVVGERIYAQATNPCRRHFMFDSATQQWDPWVLFGTSPCKGPFSIDHVGQIFCYGRGRCVGGFMSAEFRNLFHVVFAVVKHGGAVQAVAYLVASKTGQILGLQRLPHFFEGFVGPASVNESIVIEADEDGKTMCCIVDGNSSHELKQRCLFVHSFSVEELADAGLWIRDVWRRRSYDGSLAVEQDFVRVVVKERFVYKMDAKGGFNGYSVTRMQACFL